MADAPLGPVASVGRQQRGHQRSAFASAVPDATEVSADWGVFAANLGLAALLVLLIGFPAELFNKTLEENYDEVRGWFRRGREPSHPRPRPRRFLTYTVLAALLYTALDPDAAPDRATLVLLIGLFVAIAVTTLTFELPIKFYNRYFCAEACFLRTYPGAVALAVGFVVLSRVANFQPGYLYGLIAGYAVLSGRPGTTRDEGRSVALSALCLLVLSLAAWLAWIPVNQAAEDGSGFAVLLVDAILVAVFVAGLESLTFGLVPLRFLDGHKLADWNRGLWFVLQLVPTFGFVHVLLNPRTGALDTSSDASVVGIFVLFAVFGILSVAFWAYFRFRGRPSDTVLAPSTGSGQVAVPPAGGQAVS